MYAHSIACPQSNGMRYVHWLRAMNDKLFLDAVADDPTGWIRDQAGKFGIALPAYWHVPD